MADDNIWKRGGGSYRSRGSRRRGGGRRGGGNRGGGRGKDVHPLSRLEDEDGDTQMDDPVERPSRYQPYQRGGQSRRGDRVSPFSRLGQKSSGHRPGGIRPGGGGGGTSWHKVTVLKGGSQSREWLMKALREAISEPFIAQQIHQLSDKVLFFVEEPRAAEELKSLGKIQSRDGPLNIIVKPSPPPKGLRDSGRGPRGGGGGGPQRQRFPRVSDDDAFMEEDCSQVITQVLGERYKTDTNALDLSDMFHEQRFQQNKIRASMFDRKFVESILTLIGQHCPDLMALNLSRNRLQYLESYSSLPSHLKSLKLLDLSNNDIRSLKDLEALQGMASVTDISLKGNPCEEMARDLASYCSMLRKYFPNLERLDGQSLPSPVKFDVPVAVGKLPPYVANHLPSADTKALLVNFLEQYYSLYDGESREKLLEAYSDEALFSMSILVPEHQRDHELHVYFSKSRNLCRLKDPGKRDSLLKHGKIDIVQFIRDLPRTKHHSQLFEVDIMTAASSQIAFVVHGVFSEENSKGNSPLVRSFARTFIVSVAGNSVAILNDLLFITCASPKTVQVVQDNFQASVSPAQSIAPIPQAGTQSALTSSSDQDAAVLKMAQVTKMNMEFSRRCLVENNWQYETALVAFSNLQANNQIPAEAFL